MTCAICKNEDTRLGETTFTVERAGRTFVTREVPALLCDRCGEPTFDEEVATRVFEQLASAVVTDTPHGDGRW